MNRFEAIATILIFTTVTFCLSSYGPLCSSAFPQFEIPKEWQEQMVANGAVIAKAKAELEKAREDSKRILDEVLKLNEIDRRPDVNYELRLETTQKGSSWRLYQSQM